MFKIKIMGSISDPQIKSATIGADSNSVSKFYTSTFLDTLKQLLLENNKSYHPKPTFELLIKAGLSPEMPSNFLPEEVNQILEKYDRFKNNSKNMYLNAPELI